MGGKLITILFQNSIVFYRKLQQILLHLKALCPAPTSLTKLSVQFFGALGQLNLVETALTFYKSSENKNIFI